MGTEAEHMHGGMENNAMAIPVMTCPCDVNKFDF